MNDALWLINIVKTKYKTNSDSRYRVTARGTSLFVHFGTEFLKGKNWKAAMILQPSLAIGSVCKFCHFNCDGDLFDEISNLRTTELRLWRLDSRKSFCGFYSWKKSEMIVTSHIIRDLFPVHPAARPKLLSWSPFDNLSTQILLFNIIISTQLNKPSIRIMYFS